VILTVLMPLAAPLTPPNGSTVSPLKVGVLARKAPVAGNATDETGEERSM
jgi:hypothetical protein